MAHNERDGTPEAKGRKHGSHSTSGQKGSIFFAGTMPGEKDQSLRMAVGKGPAEGQGAGRTRQSSRGTGLEGPNFEHFTALNSTYRKPETTSRKTFVTCGKGFFYSTS